LVHGPGVKLLDGLAVAKHQWVRDLHLPLPSPSYYQPGTILGPASPGPFCYWYGRRTVGILLENEGEWTPLATNTIPLHPRRTILIQGNHAQSSLAPDDTRQRIDTQLLSRQ